jgi:hypothetical protein
MKVPSRPARTPETMSSRPVQTLVNAPSTLIGAAGSAFHSGRGGAAAAGDRAGLVDVCPQATSRNASELARPTSAAPKTSLLRMVSDVFDMAVPS